MKNEQQIVQILHDGLDDPDMLQTAVRDALRILGGEVDTPPSDLLPCPFCGSQNLVLQDTREDNGAIVWSVECNDCGVETVKCSEYYGKMIAQEVWNRRVPQSSEWDWQEARELIQTAQIALCHKVPHTRARILHCLADALSLFPKEDGR